MAVGQMDEAAVLVEMLERMQQCALPSGKERDGEQNPREAG